MHRFSVMKKEFLCGFIKDVDERAGGGRGAALDHRNTGTPVNLPKATS